MYDVVIIGGGPAAVAAGVYAARKKIKTAIIAGSFGGQSLVSAEIQNWIGTVAISGFDLAKNLEAHLRAQEDIDIIESEFVEKITMLESGLFCVTTVSGKIYETKTVLCATGSSRRKLNIPGEREFDGRGVVYCSTCDAPIFKGKDVVVVGGGNAGLEAVADLIPYAKNIILLHRGETLKGDQVTQEKIISHPNVRVILNAEVLSLQGTTTLETLIYKDKKTNTTHTLSVQGVFVEIGIVPNSELVRELVVRNERNEIIVDPITQQSSRLGIWAAGDVTNGRYRQNNISVGDAIKALLNIYEYIHRD